MSDENLQQGANTMGPGQGSGSGLEQHGQAPERLTPSEEARVQSVGASQQQEAEKAAKLAVDQLQRSPNRDPNDTRPSQIGYRAPTLAEIRAREYEDARNHPFTLAVKALLDALAPEPKLGAVESTYHALRREYNELTGAVDARAVITGAGSEHEELRLSSSEAAD